MQVCTKCCYHGFCSPLTSLTKPRRGRVCFSAQNFTSLSACTVRSCGWRRSLPLNVSHEASPFSGGEQRTAAHARVPPRAPCHGDTISIVAQGQTLTLHVDSALHDTRERAARRGGGAGPAPRGRRRRGVVAAGCEFGLAWGASGLTVRSARPHFSNINGVHAEVTKRSLRTPTPRSHPFAGRAHGQPPAARRPLVRVPARSWRSSPPARTRGPRGPSAPRLDADAIAARRGASLSRLVAGAVGRRGARRVRAAGRLAARGRVRLAAGRASVGVPLPASPNVRRSDGGGGGGGSSGLGPRLRTPARAGGPPATAPAASVAGHPRFDFRRGASDGHLLLPGAPGLLAGRDRRAALLAAPAAARAATRGGRPGAVPPPSAPPRAGGGFLGSVAGRGEGGSGLRSGTAGGGGVRHALRSPTTHTVVGARR